MNKTEQNYYEFENSPKKLESEVSENWLYLKALTFPFFVSWCIFLSLPLWTCADSVYAKYCPKSKNFMFVDSEILAMKKMSGFAPGYYTAKKVRHTL